MGRLSEMLDFLNNNRTAGYMKAHYAYFWPEPEDYEARKQYRKRLAETQEQDAPKVPAKPQKPKRKRGPPFDMFARR